MSAELQPSVAEELPAPEKRPRRIAVIARTLWVWFFGAALSQELPFALLIPGWTARLMRAAAMNRWRREAGLEGLASPWPNWILGECRPTNVRPNMKQLAARAVGGLLQNLREGLGMILNAYVITGIPVLLWAFGWRYGWDNSFAKGYEQAYIGPSLSVLGIVLFIVAAIYLAPAQARQAATKDWRAFYDFRLVFALLRRRWPGWLVLALCYALTAFPLYAMQAAPFTFSNLDSHLAEATDPEVLQFNKNFYFVMGLIGFPLYAWLRVRAARLYADALLVAVRERTLGQQSLHAEEKRVLSNLGLLVLRPHEPKGPLVKAIHWTSARAGFVLGLGLLGVVWFTFVAQIYVANFIHYVGVRGWLNQPLIHIPWLNYIPEALKQSGAL